MKRFFASALVIAMICACIVSTFAVHASDADDALEYDLASELKWLGRTYEKDGAYYFNWSAAGFEFRFKGSGATATILSKEVKSNATAYLKIYVDGVEQPDVALTKASQTVTLAEGLDPDAEHTVKVLKRTNARSSPAALASLTLTDGTKLSPNAPSERLIEFVGDSITVGYATVANGASAWSTSTEDVTKTYTEYIANTFFADYHVTAISGRGIVRNTGGDTDKLLPAIYGKLDEYNNPGVEYDFARKADVVVINLGTNDCSGNNKDLTSAEFREGLRAFLLDVRAKNPDAAIIYGYGMMRTRFIEDIEQVIKELRAEGDRNIVFVPLEECSSDERALNHPTEEAYISRAEALIEAIAYRTDWVPGEEPVKEPAPEDNGPTEPTVSEDGGCGSTLVGTLPSVILAAACGAAIMRKKGRRK